MKKAQAAMEFLMTYGWAILVVLVAIGALAYLSILNPTRFTPDRCDIGPGFLCNNLKADASGDGVANDGITTDQDVIFTIQNGLGQSITTAAGAVTLTDVTDGGAPATCTVTTAAPATWNDGQSQQFIADCGALTVGNKIKGTILFNYDDGLARQKQGQIVVSVEP